MMASLAEVPAHVRGTVMGWNVLACSSVGWMAAAGLGGWMLGERGFAGFGPLTLIVAVIGAVLALASALSPSGRRHARHPSRETNRPEIYRETLVVPPASHPVRVSPPAAAPRSAPGFDGAIRRPDGRGNAGAARSSPGRIPHNGKARVVLRWVNAVRSSIPRPVKNAPPASVTTPASSSSETQPSRFIASAIPTPSCPEM